MLLPAAPQDWLPAGHLAHYINDTVDALELKAFYARYEGGGSRNQPFHPAMMVKVLIYAYATGVFSSRKIERRLHEADIGRGRKAASRRRKWIAEPPNGWIRSVLGFRQFSLRGLHRVQAEFKLVGLALNLRRMGSLQAA